MRVGVLRGDGEASSVGIWKTGCGASPDYSEATQTIGVSKPIPSLKERKEGVAACC